MLIGQLVICFIVKKYHQYIIGMTQESLKFEPMILGKTKWRWSQRFCDPIVRSVSKRKRDAAMSCVFGCSWLWRYFSAISKRGVKTQINRKDMVKWYHLPDSDSFDTLKFKETCVAAVAGICILIEEKSAQTWIKTRKTSRLWYLSNDFVIY